MTARRSAELVTPGRLIAWGIAVALGAAFGAGVSAALGALAGWVLGWIVVFGLIVGLLAATGHLATVMRLLGNPTRAVSSAPGELPPDLPFAVWLVLFSLGTVVGAML